ncbi:NRT-like protein, partial [Mya arenaria]
DQSLLKRQRPIRRVRPLKWTSVEYVEFITSLQEHIRSEEFPMPVLQLAICVEDHHSRLTAPTKTAGADALTLENLAARVCRETPFHCQHDDWKRELALFEHIGYAPTEQLARDHDVVYVSINYRLNAFGFMWLDMLRVGSHTNTSGNYGFMDMLTGLHWMQNNIRQFGGDPNQVTSSDGTAIYALLASPLGRGLFHKAWTISGSPVMNKTAAEADADNQVFVHNTGCQDADCLYTLTPEHVLASVPWEEFPYWAMSDLTGIPAKDRFNDALPVVDGTTSHEVSLESSPQAVTNWTWKDNKYQAYLYLENVHTPEFQLASLVTDLRVTCGSEYLALVMATSFTSPVFRYIAEYAPSAPMKAFWVTLPARYAFHGIDAFYKTLGLMIDNKTDADRQWEVNVQQKILSFMRNGSPFTADWGMFPGQTAVLSQNTTVTAGYHTAECLFWLKNGFFSYSWIN